MMKFKKFLAGFILFNILFFNAALAFEDTKKYLSYQDLYLDFDKHEKINRKIFNFNLKLNKIFVKKIHIVWESLVPNFLVDGLNAMYYNIEYPKKVVSCLLQRDFDAVKHVTKRFIINTTLGVAGFIDAADKLFKLEKYNEDMEQALAKCKMKCGSYIVLPFLSSTSSRDITGRILDFLLTPTTYIASPVAAAVKLGLLINRTAFIQPIIKMVESNYADSYDIARKFYGLEKYIKLSNYDRKNVLDKANQKFDEKNLKKEELLDVKGAIKDTDKSFIYLSDDKLHPDIYLENFNSQYPVLDSMRGALFSLNGKKSFWGEFSLWNNGFSKKMTVASVNIAPASQKYNFRYILAKDKTSPLAFLFPSVGEGIYNTSSQKLAEILYKQGYSVVIIGSQFQWEFLKSLKETDRVGLINNDIKHINTLLSNIVSYLSKKYDRVFMKRIALGTSLGAYSVLYLANNQYELGANNINKFIAISPPYELFYAINQIDSIISSWKNYPDDIKEKIALTAAKLLYTYNHKDNYISQLNTKGLPFSDFEAKLITGFIFHQKISDLIYVSELAHKKEDKKGTYEMIYNMNYSDYIKKYFLSSYSLDEIRKITSLDSIQNYLINKDNYIIYESMDDYLLAPVHLRKLKHLCDNKIRLISNGAHLGYMYRDEFISDLVNQIKIK